MKTILAFVDRLRPGTELLMVHHRARLLRRDRYDNPVFKKSKAQMRKVLSKTCDTVRFEVIGGAFLGIGTILSIPARRDVEFEGETMTVYTKVRWNGPKGQTTKRMPLITYRFL